MSRSTLRLALADFLGENVAGITTVYRSFPKIAQGTDMFQFLQTSGCIAVIHLNTEREKRLSLGGAHNGWKRVDTVVDIHLFFQSLEPEGEDAMDAFDALVENLKEQIRSDRNLGTPNDGSVVWQAGEDMAGRYSEPVFNAQVTQIWGVVSTTATEMVAS